MCAIVLRIVCYWKKSEETTDTKNSMDDLHQWRHKNGWLGRQRNRWNRKCRLTLALRQMTNIISADTVRGLRLFMSFANCCPLLLVGWILKHTLRTSSHFWCHTSTWFGLAHCRQDVSNWIGLSVFPVFGRFVSKAPFQSFPYLLIRHRQIVICFIMLAHYVQWALFAGVFATRHSSLCFGLWRLVPDRFR